MQCNAGIWKSSSDFDNLEPFTIRKPYAGCPFGAPIYVHFKII